MDSMLYNKLLRTPVYTGTPWGAGKGKAQGETDNSPFKELLEQKLNEESEVSFSRHAVECMVERGVDVSSGNLERLNQGVRLAEEKGLKEPPTLPDSTAFVVNVKNNKAITVIHEDDLKGAVFTNIDGTAMIQPVPQEAYLTPNDGGIRRLEKENRLYAKIITFSRVRYADTSDKIRRYR